jgi:hypothetical protein
MKWRWRTNPCATWHAKRHEPPRERPGSNCSEFSKPAFHRPGALGGIFAWGDDNYGSTRGRSEIDDAAEPLFHSVKGNGLVAIPASLCTGREEEVAACVCVAMVGRHLDVETGAS